MSIGKSYSKNNNNQGSIDKTFYGRFRLLDKEKSLSADFWKGLLRLTMSKVEGSDSSFNITELTNIFINQNKALVLKDALEKMISNPKDKMCYGINSGSGDQQGILFLKRLDDKKLQLSMGKIDSNGKYITYEEMIFEPFYGYLSGSDLHNNPGDYTNNLVANHELKLLLVLVEEFIKGIAGGIAYSTLDMNRYNYEKNNKLFVAIAEKLGVSTGYNKGNSGNSFFNNKSNTNYNNKSSFGNNSNDDNDYDESWGDDE